MIFPDSVIACRAGHQAMGADIILAILAALADMILTIGLFTDTTGYGMTYIPICYNHCTGHHGRCTREIPQDLLNSGSDWPFRRVIWPLIGKIEHLILGIPRFEGGLVIGGVIAAENHR
jgi:hypothetical protein